MPLDFINKNGKTLRHSHQPHANGVPSFVPEQDQHSPLQQDARDEHLDAAIATIPGGDYGTRVQGLEELSHNFKRRVAAHLLPALKEEMQRRPHDTYDEKKDMVVWVNAELRSLGLAIRFPGSDREATLVAIPGRHPDEGAFQLRSNGEDGKVKTFNAVKLSKFLDHLELMEARPRREVFIGWRGRVGQQRDGASLA